MNCSYCCNGQWLLKTQLFHEVFGTSVRVIETIWELVICNAVLHPMRERPEHLLWTFNFLKVDPKQGSGCAVVSASNSTVNPKTLRKWVWAIIEAISELVDIVVSLFDCRVLFFLQRSDQCQAVVVVDDIYVEIIVIHHSHLSLHCPHRLTHSFLVPPLAKLQVDFESQLLMTSATIA